MTPEEMLLSLPDLSMEAAQDYLEYRKKSKKNPLNRTAWTAICKEIFKSGWNPDDALAEAMNREWRGLKAIWLAKIQNDEMVMMQQIRNAPDRRGFIEKHTDTSWRDGLIDKTKPDKRGFIERHFGDMSWADDL